MNKPLPDFSGFQRFIHVCRGFRVYTKSGDFVSAVLSKAAMVL